jgi:hypothetical protein
VNLQAALQGQALPYSTLTGGVRHIYRREGVRGLYRGTGVTTLRAALVTSAAIGTYDVIKNNIVKPYLRVDDGFALFSVCSMLAGVVTTTVANPGACLKYMPCHCHCHCHCHCMTVTALTTTLLLPPSSSRRGQDALHERRLPVRAAVRRAHGLGGRPAGAHAGKRQRHMHVLMYTYTLYIYIHTYMYIYI